MLTTEKTTAAVAQAQGKSVTELKALRDHYRYGRASDLGLAVGEKNSISAQLTTMLDAAERDAGVVPPYTSPRPRSSRYIGGYFADPRNFEML
ncbi:MAG: hypothetical protein EKK55_06955 [Rhodocyclaceae bacterium]|nr:MAG: hypothetical protein EKK55_06955 [Rhodocyclaceae bacterium]